MSVAQKNGDGRDQEKYMPIKNLSQLKRAMQEGRVFRIIEHYVKPEYSGQLRRPGRVQTNGFYSKIADNPFHVLNTLNGCQGSYLAYGKARDWSFEDGICTLMHHSGEHLVWKIGILI